MGTNGCICQKSRLQSWLESAEAVTLVIRRMALNIAVGIGSLAAGVGVLVALLR